MKAIVRPLGMRKFDRSQIPLLIISIVLTWFIIAFLILPNLNILLTTLFVDGKFSPEPFVKIFNSDRAVKGLLNSFLLGITLPITTSLLGITLVLITDYFDVKGASLLRLVYMIPLIFGGMMLANGYLFIYGPKGMITRFLLQINPELDLNWFTGYGAVLFLMTFACTNYYMIFFRNQLNSIDFQTVEAAKNLGASQWQIITKVVLPTLKPTITTCIVLLFQTGIGAMSAPLIFGGSEFETISPLILTFSQRPTSRPLAAVLALILGISQIILLWMLQRSEKKGNYISISKVKTPLQKQKIENKLANILVHGFAYLAMIIYLLPFLAVIIFSFTDYYSITTSTLSWDRLTLDNYVRLLTDANTYKPFLTSIIYSGLAAFIVVIAMLYVARLIHKYNNKLTGLLEYLLHIPWLLPSLLFALGLILTYSVPQKILFNQILTGTWIIMLIGYIVVLIPNTLRFLKAAYYGVDKNLEDAALNLGAKPFYTFWRIILPLVLPTAAAMFALNFNGKLSDYDLSVFLYHPLNPPLGVIIRSNTDIEASVEGVANNFVYTVILMTISSIVLYFVYGKGSNIFKKKSRKQRKAATKNEDMIVAPNNLNS